MARTGASPTVEEMTRAMSDAHKAPLAEGREQGRAVRSYRAAVEANEPHRGPMRTPEGIEPRVLKAARIGRGQ
jgi:hypothetical protein